MIKKFGVGQPVLRKEDIKFITGKSTYLDDISFDQQYYAYFVRSDYAHAKIQRIDIDKAQNLKGVEAVFTAKDFKQDCSNYIPCYIDGDFDGKTRNYPGRPIFVDQKIYHVGEIIAVIIADSLDKAKDAAELIEIKIEELKPYVKMQESIVDTETQIHPHAPKNICFQWKDGNQDKTEKAFLEADHIIELKLVNNRVIGNPIETRGAIACYLEDEDQIELHISSQGSHFIRNCIADDVLNIDHNKLRVITHQVGGGFGVKIFAYPEYAIVAWLSKKLRKPIKWIADRSEAFISDTHGRDHETDVKLCLDNTGRFLGLKCKTLANMGAHLSNYAPFIPSAGAQGMHTGVYNIPTAYIEVLGVYTNTLSVDAYRGAGRPEATYMIERLIDKAALELNISPKSIRERNFIRHDEMPFKNYLGRTIEYADFQKIMNEALKKIDYDGFEKRKKQKSTQGVLKGIGFSTYIEVCAGGGPENAWLKLKDGHLQLKVGSQSSGQGHETAFSQILSEKLEIQCENIDFIQGDTAKISSGTGTDASRSLVIGGHAVKGVAKALLEKAKEKARDYFEASTKDIEYQEGYFYIVGTDIKVSLFDMEEIIASYEFQPDGETYPNGCHICEVDVCEYTGKISIVRYVVVDDFGFSLNPVLLEGQVHGGVVQGIGQAWLEKALYDEETGQLLTGSLMDYPLPKASDLSTIEFSTQNIPCEKNSMGVKGAGEAGAIGSCPAFVNAIVNALNDYKGREITHIDMPLTSEKIWRLLHG